MSLIKEFINLFADPRLFFLLSVVALAVIVWKREAFARNSVGYGLMAFLTVFFLFGLFDENFVLIIAKADNVPIVALIFLLIFFTWYSMREAVRNDQRLAAGEVSRLSQMCYSFTIPDQVLIENLLAVFLFIVQH